MCRAEVKNTPYEALVANVFPFSSAEDAPTQNLSPDALDDTIRLESLKQDSIQTYINQVIHAWRGLEKSILGHTVYPDTYLNSWKNGNATQGLLVSQQQKLSAESLKTSDDVFKEIKTFNLIVDQLNATCTSRHEEFSQLRKILGDKLLQDQELHPEFQSLIYPNGKPPVGDVASQVRNRMKETRRLGAEQSSLYWNLLAHTRVGKLMQTSTDLQKHVGVWNPLSCVENGQKFKPLPNELSKFTQMMTASLDSVRITYRKTLADLVEDRKENAEVVLKKYLKSSPYAVSQTLLANPSTTNAHQTCALILDIKSSSEIKEEVTAWVAPLLAVFTGGAASLSSSAEGAMVFASVAAAMNGLWMYSTVSDLYTTIQMEKWLKYALTSQQIEPSEGAILLQSIQSSYPMSVLNLALAGAGVAATSVKAANILRLKSYQRYLNVQGGATSQAWSKLPQTKPTPKVDGRSSNPFAEKMGVRFTKPSNAPESQVAGSVLDDLLNWVNNKTTPPKSPSGSGSGAGVAIAEKTQVAAKPAIVRETAPSKLPQNSLSHKQLQAEASKQVQQSFEPLKQIKTIPVVLDPKPMELGGLIQQNMDLTPMKNVGDPVTDSSDLLSRDDYLKQVQLEQEAMQVLAGTAAFKAEHTSFICNWAKFGSGTLQSKAEEFVAKRGIDCNATKTTSNHPLYNLTVPANAFPHHEEFNLLEILRKVVSIHPIVITKQDQETFEWLDKNKRTIRSVLRWYQNHAPKKAKAKIQFWTTYIDIQIINLLLKQGGATKLRDYFGGRALTSEEEQIIQKYPRINGRDAYVAYYPVFGKANRFDGYLNWTPINRFSLEPEFKSLGHTESQRWRDFTRVHPHHLTHQETANEMRLFNSEMRGGLDPKIVFERLQHLPKEMVREVFNDLLVNASHRPIKLEESYHAIRNIYGVHRGWPAQIAWQEFGRSPLSAIRGFLGDDDVYFETKRKNISEKLHHSLTALLSEANDSYWWILYGARKYLDDLRGQPRKAYVEFQKTINYDAKDKSVRDLTDILLYLTYKKNLRLKGDIRFASEENQYKLDEFILNDATFRQYLIEDLKLNSRTANNLTIDMADAGIFGDILLQKISQQSQMEKHQKETVRRRIESLVKHAKRIHQVIAQNHYSIKNPKMSVEQLEALRSIFEELGHKVLVPVEALQVLYYIHQLSDSHEKNRLVLSVLPDYLLKISIAPDVTRERTLDMSLQLASDDIHLLGDHLPLKDVEKPFYSDLRDDAEKFLIQARDNRTVNHLIFNRHLIDLKGYGQETIHQILKMVGYNQFSPEQQNEFMNVLAELSTIQDVDQLKQALNIFKTILHLNYKIPLRNREPNNVHEIVRVLTHPEHGLFRLSRISMQQPYDPIQMQRSIALLEYMDKQVDRGLVLLNQNNHMTDIIYVYLYGNYYDATGFVREKADKILQNYNLWSREISNLRSISKNQKTSLQKMMLAIVDDQQLPPKSIPSLVELLSGLHGDNWKGYSSVWLNKHRKTGRSYNDHVLQSLFEAHHSLKKMELPSETIQKLLNDSYQAFERKVRVFNEKFYKTNKTSGQGKKIENLSNELQIEFNHSISSSRAKEYFLSFASLNNQGVNQFIRLGDRNHELFNRAYLVHLMNAIDLNKQRINDRLQVLILELSKENGESTESAKTIVAELSENNILGIADPEILIGQETDQISNPKWILAAQVIVNPFYPNIFGPEVEATIVEISRDPSNSKIKNQAIAWLNANPEALAGGQFGSQFQKVKDRMDFILKEIEEKPYPMGSILSYFGEDLKQDAKVKSFIRGHEINATYDQVKIFKNFAERYGIYPNDLPQNIKTQLLQFLWYVHAHEKDKHFNLAALKMWMEDVVASALDETVVSDEIHEDISLLAKSHILGMSEQEIGYRRIARGVLHEKTAISAIRGLDGKPLNRLDKLGVIKAIENFYVTDLQYRKIAAELLKNAGLRLPTLRSEDPTNPYYHAEQILSGNQVLDFNKLGVYEAIKGISADSKHPDQAKAVDWLEKNPLVAPLKPVLAPVVPVASNPLVASSDLVIRVWNYQNNQNVIKTWNDYLMDSDTFRSRVGQACWSKIVAQGGILNVPVIDENPMSYKRVYQLCGEEWGWKSYAQLEKYAAGLRYRSENFDYEHWYIRFVGKEPNIGSKLDQVSSQPSLSEQEKAVELSSLHEKLEIALNEARKNKIEDAKSRYSDQLSADKRREFNLIKQSINFNSFIKQQKDFLLLLHWIDQHTSKNCVTGQCEISGDDRKLIEHFLRTRFHLGEVKIRRYSTMLIESGLVGQDVSDEETGKMSLEQVRSIYQDEFKKLGKDRYEMANLLALYNDNSKVLLAAMLRNSQAHQDFICYQSLGINQKFKTNALDLIQHLGIKCRHHDESQMIRFAELKAPSVALNLELLEYLTKVNPGDLALFTESTDYLLNDGKMGTLKASYVPYILQLQIGSDEIAGNARTWWDNYSIRHPDAKSATALINKSVEEPGFVSIEHLAWIREFSKLDNDLGFQARVWIIEHEKFVIDYHLTDKHSESAAKEENLSAYVFLFDLLIKSTNIMRGQVADWHKHIEPNVAIWHQLLKEIEKKSKLSPWELAEIERLFTYVHLIPKENDDKYKALIALKIYLEAQYGYKDPHDGLIKEMSKKGIEMLGLDDLGDKGYIRPDASPRDIIKNLLDNYTHVEINEALLAEMGKIYKNPSDSLRGSLIEWIDQHWDEYDTKFYIPAELYAEEVIAHRDPKEPTPGQMFMIHLLNERSPAGKDNSLNKERARRWLSRHAATTPTLNVVKSDPVNQDEAKIYAERTYSMLEGFVPAEIVAAIASNSINPDLSAQERANAQAFLDLIKPEIDTAHTMMKIEGIFRDHSRQVSYNESFEYEGSRITVSVDPNGGLKVTELVVLTGQKFGFEATYQKDAVNSIVTVHSRLKATDAMKEIVQSRLLDEENMYDLMFRYFKIYQKFDVKKFREIWTLHGPVDSVSNAVAYKLNRQNHSNVNAAINVHVSKYYTEHGYEVDQVNPHTYSDGNEYVSVIYKPSLNDIEIRSLLNPSRPVSGAPVVITMVPTEKGLSQKRNGTTDPTNDAVAETVYSPQKITVEEVLNSWSPPYPLSDELLHEIIKLRFDQSHPLHKRAKGFLTIHSVNKTYPEYLVPVSKNKNVPRNRTGFESLLNDINDLSTVRLTQSEIDLIASSVTEEFAFLDKSKKWSRNHKGEFTAGSTKMYLSPRKMMTELYVDFCFYILWDEKGKPYFFVYDREPNFTFKSKIILLSDLSHLSKYITTEAYRHSWDEILDQPYYYYEMQDGKWTKISFNKHVQSVKAAMKTEFVRYVQADDLIEDMQDVVLAPVKAIPQVVVQEKVLEVAEIQDPVIHFPSPIVSTPVIADENQDYINTRPIWSAVFFVFRSMAESLLGTTKSKTLDAIEEKHLPEHLTQKQLKQIFTWAANTDLKNPKFKNESLKWLRLNGILKQGYEPAEIKHLSESVELSGARHNPYHLYEMSSIELYKRYLEMHLKYLPIPKKGVFELGWDDIQMQTHKDFLNIINIVLTNQDVSKEEIADVSFKPTFFIQLLPKGKTIKFDGGESNAYGMITHDLDHILISNLNYMNLYKEHGPDSKLIDENEREKRIEWRKEFYFSLKQKILDQNDHSRLEAFINLWFMYHEGLDTLQVLNDQGADFFSPKFLLNVPDQKWKKLIQEVMRRSVKGNLGTSIASKDDYEHVIKTIQQHAKEKEEDSYQSYVPKKLSLGQKAEQIIYGDGKFKFDDEILYVMKQMTEEPRAHSEKIKTWIREHIDPTDPFGIALRNHAEPALSRSEFHESQGQYVSIQFLSQYATGNFQELSEKWLQRRQNLKSQVKE